MEDATLTQKLPHFRLRWLDPGQSPPKCDTQCAG